MQASCQWVGIGCERQRPCPPPGQRSKRSWSAAGADAQCGQLAANSEQALEQAALGALVWATVAIAVAAAAVAAAIVEYGNTRAVSTML